jgi:hypothetical protein
MHAVGVFMGLCLRTGCGCFLPFPSPIFLDILANERYPPQHLFPFTTTAALAIRFGICALYPEPALDLLSRSELYSCLSTGSVPTHLPYWMRCNAQYTSPLRSDAFLVQCFWMSVYELSTADCHSLLASIHQALLAKHILAHGQQQVEEAGEEGWLCIALSGGQEIILDPKSHTIHLPSCSSCLVMQRALQRLLVSIRGSAL